MERTKSRILNPRQTSMRLKLHYNGLYTWHTQSMGYIFSKFARKRPEHNPTSCENLLLSNARKHNLIQVRHLMKKHLSVKFGKQF